jgi:hypothetical protein
VTIVDDDQSVKFSALGYSVLENIGPAAIVVERLGTATGTVTVHVRPATAAPPLPPTTRP